MPFTLEDIESQALTLTADARADLVERLTNSLVADNNQTPARRAWLALARKRRDEIRSGAVRGIPGDEGSALVRKLVGR